VYGITSSLLTTSSGRKFGKTEAGTVWLDENKTSAYEFYQYWIRTEDQDVIKLLKLFTFLSLDEITELQRQVQTEPEKRQAQRILAEEVTKWVRGAEQTALAQKASGVLFGREISGLSDRDLNRIFVDVPSMSMPRDRLNAGIELLDALCETGLCTSRGEAKKLVKAGGAYINNSKVSDMNQKLTPKSLASESILVLRTGKKKYFLLKFE